MYCFKSRIRYSEVDEYGFLTMGNAVNYLQDCSTFQSEDLGVGVDFLKEHQTAWVLNAWQIDILDLPRLGDLVITETWAYDFKGIYGCRNFLMKKTDGTELIKANSIWIYFDLVQKKPIKATEEQIKCYKMSKKLDMEYLPRKVVIAEGGCLYEPIVIRRHHIDTNHHVNNGQYIQMALDVLPESVKCTRLRAEYRKAAVLGDCLIPRVIQNNAGYLVAMEDREGMSYVNLEFTVG